MEYWIEQIIGNLYGVFYDNGNHSVNVFEGTYSECESYKNSK